LSLEVVYYLVNDAQKSVLERINGQHTLLPKTPAKVALFWVDHKNKKNKNKMAGVTKGKSKKTKKPVNPVRGDRIIFLKGEYEGEKGWTNKAKSPTSLSVFVIVDGGQNSKDDIEWATCVRKTLVMLYTEPTCAEELVIQEDPKASYHLTGFAQAIAECGMTATPELLLLVKHHIETACVVQLEKGKKAKYSETALRVIHLKEKQAERPKRRGSGDQNATMEDPGEEATQPRPTQQTRRRNPVGTST